MLNNQLIIDLNTIVTIAGMLYTYNILMNHICLGI